MTDIHDAIEAWHDSPEDGVPLHEYLGMTWEQYARWAEVGELPEGSPFTDKADQDPGVGPRILAPVLASNGDLSGDMENR